MPPSIFISPHPFFEAGRINGRKQANAAFMRTLLELDPFDEYHFFVSNPEALAKAWKEEAPLPALRRGAAKARFRTDLLPFLASNPCAVCHLSDPINDFVTMAVARNRLSPALFPVTAVNHTISYTSYAANFQACVWQGWSPRDAMGCNSHCARDVLRRCFEHFGASGRGDTPRLEVVPMGARPRDGARDAGLRAAMRQRLDLKEDSVLLLLFGRIALADKLDPQPLLLALRRVAEQWPGLDLRLAVSGAQENDDGAGGMLTVLAKKFNLSLSVLPNPSLRDKDALFAAADIFVSPSDNIQETFGLTLVEAAMAGLPVIASDWNGYRDTVRHGVTGLLVPTVTHADTPGLDLEARILFENQYHFLRGQSTSVSVPALAEAMAALAADPGLRRRMGEAARERALRHFTWEAVARQWLAFWNALAAVPLAPEEEARLRAVPHPLQLPYGKIFAPFASHALEPSARVAATDVARMLLRRELPWEAMNLFNLGFSEADVRPLVVHARRPVSVEELAARCALPRETLERRVLWCLKHDILELCPA